jgi:hypothetical protein
MHHIAMTTSVERVTTSPTTRRLWSMHLLQQCIAAPAVRLAVAAPDPHGAVAAAAGQHVACSALAHVFQA